MSRRVHQMQQVVLSLVVIQHAACLRLHGNASLAFNIQLIQDLFVPTRFDSARELEQAVAESAFTMVDVRDYAEVAKALDWNRGDTFFEVRLRL